MTRSMFSRWWFLLALALPAYPQTTLTGAIQFSTNSTGAAYGGQVWNTLGGDSKWDLWLAQNPDATSPVNGPSDAQATINLPLMRGKSYLYYIFGAPGSSTGVNGLNLFFDGNNSVPGISAFGATNGSVFLPDANSTLTLENTAVAGSGRNFYVSGDRVVVLTGYEWHAPATPPGDVCQPEEFAPGGGVSFFGSFILRVFLAAALTSSLPSGSPGTKITLTGSGFPPMESVNIYFGGFGSLPFATATADASGGFAVAAREPQAPYGPEDVYAVGRSSGKLGAASVFVTPGLVVSPRIGSPGGKAAAQGSGFGAGEAVSVFWSNPRQLLGTATASSAGSFVGSDALEFTIPAGAPPGINAVTAIGQTTTAIAIGRITIE